VPGHGIQQRPYRPANPRALATVRLSYPRMQAEAGPCGVWPEDVGPALGSPYMENRSHWNHGCASQRNLAAMVSNPADLVQPRAETPPYTGRRSTVLEKYRKGDGTASTAGSSDNKGKISDIGQ
jgi:pilus assembly protein CpaD